MYLYVNDMKFYKAHTNGNDFVIIEGNANKLTDDQKRLIADRKYGVGCDQIIFFTFTDGRCFLEFFNQDGSHASMCGNGSCAVALLISRKYGIDEIELNVLDGNENCVSKSSSSVFFRRFAKYFSCQGLRFLSFARKTLERAESEAYLDRFGGRDVVKSREYHIAPPKNIYKARIAGNEVTAAFPLPEQCGNIIITGNKHLILDMSEINNATTLAKTNPDCNIHFVETVAQNILKIKTFERGVGWTLACGSGAVAVGYHSKIRGKIEILHDGGKSIVEVKETSVALTTQPKIVYKGLWIE